MADKKRISKSIRAQVLLRDNYICRACGFGGSGNFDPFLDCDHAIAEKDGGLATLENLQCLCKACNIHKAGNSWTFKVRIANQPEDVWAHNQAVMSSAFYRDTAKRLRMLK